MGYKKSEETKKRILEAAFEQFSLYGFHGASLREIAAECGTSHPGIRHHFASKEELLIEVLKERDERTRILVRNQLHANGFCVDALVNVARINAKDRGMVELFTSMAAQASNPGHPAHEYFKTRYDTLRAMWGDILEEAKQVGAVREDLDPAVSGQVLLSIMDGLQVQWLLDPELVDMPKALELGLRALIN